MFTKMPFGFTLAEVLITLGIIGIVAAMTIPTMIANTQRQDFAALFQKNYSNIQNMLKMYITEQGVDNLGSTTLYNGSSFADVSVQNELDNTIQKYFKVLKTCRRDTNDSSCALIEKFIGGSGSTTFATGSDYYAFITNDGIENFLMLGPSCSPDFSKTGKIKANCGILAYDVNGTKGPNIYGKDFFVGFLINYDGTLYPFYGTEFAIFMNNSSYYWKNTSTYCGTVGNTDMTNVTGNGCTARVMENSWKIDYW